MPYVKNYAPGGWQNDIPGATPIAAANLNNLETQYDEAYADIPRRVRKTADQTINNSEVLVNVTDLVLPVGANEIWEFFLLIRNISVSDTPDMDIAFTIPVAGSLVCAFGVSNIAETDGTAEVDISATTVNWIKRFNYIYIGGANAGNVQLQWAQATARANDTVMKAGSFIIGYKLG